MRGESLSLFFQTNLLKILTENNIEGLVICGMMSHMCIDTTTRACIEYGINVTLLEDACATKNMMFRNEMIPAETVHKVFMASLDKMFATVVRTAELMI